MKRRSDEKGKKTLDVEQQVSEFERRCHAAGLKVTPQRTAIYRTLLVSKDHPSAEDVYMRVKEEMGSISFDTVNRTLLTLAEIGAAFVVEGTGQPRRFDAGMEDHQHFRCVRCGRIIDFHHSPFDAIETPAELKRCRVLRKSVYFEGFCDRCAHL